MNESIFRTLVAFGGITATLCFIFICAGLCATTREDKELAKNAVTSTATVTRIFEKYAHESDFGTYVLSYSYNVGGKNYTGSEEKPGEVPDDVQVGSMIRIRYSREKPSVSKPI